MADAREREAIESSTDVQRGLREVGAEVAMGRPGLFLGRSPQGYCLIAGATGLASCDAARGGHLVVLGLNVAGLRALRSRIDSLLGDPSTAPLPEGLIVS